MDTIFALSSAAGRAGIAVIRVSGPEAKTVLIRMAAPLPPERRASLRHVVHPETGAPLDQGMVIWFQGPRSATGEDVAELHIHGGRAVVASVLGALTAVAKCRPAEPGEFTRRAFLNRRLDLAQVEGLADLIAAETEAQRRAALRHVDGSLSRRYESWRARLLRSLAYVEATIDFADEELPSDLLGQVRINLGGLASEIESFLTRSSKSRSIRDGFAIAIVGEPNVGKSSLLNAIAGREAAIVSERAGTTRDVITVRLDLGGYLVILSDTAGVREASDEIEAEGVARARREAERADLRLVIVDATRDAIPAQLESLLHDGDLIVANKADLVTPSVASRHLPRQRERKGAVGASAFLPRLRGRWPDSRSEEGPEGESATRVLLVSAETGQGLDQLLHRLTEMVSAGISAEGQLSLTHVRHQRALEAVVTRVRGALGTSGDRVELFAEELRSATQELGRIAGRVDVEDLLDLVFRDFCIGK